MDERGWIIGRPTAVALAQQAGVSWMRRSIAWNLVEPRQGEYDFSAIDSYLNGIIDAGFAPIVYLSNNPSWIANTPCGPIDTNDPAIMAEFTDFVSAVAARYPQVRLWSLYNEPDNAAYVLNKYSSGGCFGDHITNDINSNGVNDRADYARMLAAARQAVHRANPNAQLALGALAYDNFDTTAPAWYWSDKGTFNFNFLPELLTYMRANPLPSGEAYFDVFMFNYYDGYAPLWERVAAGKGIQAKAKYLQTQMSAYAMSWPLLVGETGADSESNSADGQARCMEMTMVRGAASGLRGVVWWTFRDEPLNSWYFGVVSEDYAPKPSYTAFQTLTRELSGFRYVSTLTGTTDFSEIEAYEFNVAGKKKIVLWSIRRMGDGSTFACANARWGRIATFGPNVTQVRLVHMDGTQTGIPDGGARDKDTRTGYIGIQVDNPTIAQPYP